MRNVLGIALLVALMGCQTTVAGPESSVQELRASRSATSGEVFLGLDHLVTDANGAPMDCTAGDIEVDIEVSPDGAAGSWAAVDGSRVQVECVSAGGGDFALVLDNSGSVAEELPLIRKAAQRLAMPVIDEGGQVSVVRVSTDARIEKHLGSDRDAVSEALDELHVSNGWTALYDGVRMGNETLGAAMIAGAPADDIDSFCTAAKKMGIVVMTDGRENNSANVKLLSEDYPGDGIDTSLEDLMELAVGGVSTPIYTIGVGDDADHEALSALAAHSGGRHLRVPSYREAEDAFGLIADYANAGHRVCASLPRTECGMMHVRVNHRWVGADGQVSSGSSVQQIHVPCEERSQGRRAAVLMTITQPEIPTAVQGDLVRELVDYVSPVGTPSVLVVRDDNHHNEWKQDSEDVAAMLEAAGYDVEFMKEPKKGLDPSLVAGHDVVWFSNPGYPIDDVASMDTLRGFDGGVIVQGDDISWSMGRQFDVMPLSKLVYKDNGTSACGERIDNRRGGAYQVEFGNDHPLQSLRGVSFQYKDDIDRTEPSNSGEQVVATATVVGASGTNPTCAPRPVVSIWQP